MAATSGADHSRDAQIIAGAILVVITGLLAVTGRKRRVAKQEVTWRDSAGVDHTIRAGWVVPPGAIVSDGNTVGERRLSAFRLLYLGKDNRASTSKAVALAWTYAVAYGLLALLFAKLLGADKPWDAQEKDGLEEAYLLLLGGPYAAAVIAKYTAVATDGADNKTTDPSGGGPGSDVKNLVSDDEGDTDIGDFQYVLFNLIALTYFFTQFVPNLEHGFPNLPELLVGLALTSAGGYAAKKAAVSASGPQLTSVFPEKVAVGATLEIWGRSLVHEGDKPRVSIGGVAATAVDVLSSVGDGHSLKATVPTLTAGEHKVKVTTSTGAPALTTGGTDYLTVTVA